MEETRNDIPRPEKKDRTLLGVLLAGCGCLLLIGVIFGFFAAKFFVFANAPRDVVKAHLQAIQENDFRLAYSHFTPEYRGGTSLEDFRSQFGAFSEMLPYRELHVNNIKIENNKAYVDGTITGRDDSIFPIHYELACAEGVWKIASFGWTYPGDRQSI